MTHLILIKTLNAFAPGDTETQEFHGKLRLGESIHGDFRRMRNYRFHKKLFSLLQMSFDLWEPGEIDSKYGVPEKNFERFREDVTILAGYYHTEIRLDGSVRIAADSISFGKMDEDTFGKLYQNVLTVLMKRIPVMGKMTPEEIDSITKKLLDYA